MSETRQRWRLIVARGEAARDLAQRDVVTAWDTALEASDLPLAMTDSAVPRSRVSFGAPVPVGMLAQREPIDVGLAERRRITEVRAEVERVSPGGYTLVDLYDVWPGAPALAASIVAGEYRATLGAADGSPIGDGDLESAVTGLLEATRIVRHREKAGATVEVDIRPLVLGLRRFGPAADGSVDVWMRLRLGGDGGVGRPDEVIAALGDGLGMPLTTRYLSRERVVLTDGPA